jgi:hypothetical protein
MAGEATAAAAAMMEMAAVTSVAMPRTFQNGRPSSTP